MNDDINAQLAGPPQGPTGFKVGNPPPAVKTYFYKQPTGNVISVSEREAWGLHKKGWEQVGCSDGRVFQEAVRDSHKIYNDQIKAFKEKNPGVITPQEYKDEALAIAQERIRQGERDELEAARGHIEIPRDFDYQGHPKAIAQFRR